MTTHLQLGNQAMRRGDHAQATRHYLDALAKAPYLAGSIGVNLTLTRRRWVAERDPGARPRVLVFAGAMSQDAQRLADLAGWHAVHADVTALTSGADAPRGLAASVTAASLGTANFLDAAFAAVAARPCELLHLCSPSAPGLFLAWLCKALWGARVVVHLNGPSPGRRADAPAPSTSLFESSWHGWAASLAEAFDGLTGTQPLKTQHGGAKPLVLGQSAGDSDASALADLVGRLLARTAVPVPASLHAMVERWLCTPSGAPLRTVLGFDATSPKGNVAPTTTSAAASPAPKRPSTPVVAPLPRAASPAEPAAVPPRAVGVQPRAAAWSVEPSGEHRQLQVLGQTIARFSRRTVGPGDPWAPLAVWLDLHGVPWHEAVRWSDGSDTPTAVLGSQGLPLRRTMSHAGTELVDVWYATDACLRWRIEPAPGGAWAEQPVVLSFYQLHAATLQVQRLMSAALEGDGPVFVDVPLAQPLLPVFVVATTPGGDALQACVLPFPSLCRGGLHHAELAMLGSGPSPMDSLEELSHSFAVELCYGAGTLSVAGLEIDLTGALGAEKVFATPVRQWLGAVLRTAAPQPLASIGEETPASSRAHLEAVCREPVGQLSKEAQARMADRATAGRLRLALSADCLPSLSALVSRRLDLPAGTGLCAGAYAVAHAVTGQPRCVVTPPPMDEALLALQPASRPLPFPVLRPSAKSSSNFVADGVADLPLAIRYADDAVAHPATLLLPAAPDFERPLLRRRLEPSERARARVSVLLVPEAGATDIAAFAESLANQTLAAQVDLVVALPPAAHVDRQAWATHLSSTCPERHRLLTCNDARPAAAWNQAAAHATGDALLLAQPSALLHDPRTLETLYTLMQAHRVATAACIVLREVAFKKGTELRFASGGIFPAQIGFAGRSALLLAEPSTTTAFPNATYPVLGNSFRLAMVSRRAWSELGGLNAERFPRDRFDLDFCLRALRAGWRHLCTSAVSASALGADSRPREHADTHALRLLPLQRWHEVLAATTQLRDLMP